MRIQYKSMQISLLIVFSMTLVYQVSFVQLSVFGHGSSSFYNDVEFQCFENFQGLPSLYQLDALNNKTYFYQNGFPGTIVTHTNYIFNGYSDYPPYLQLMPAVDVCWAMQKTYLYLGAISQYYGRDGNDNVGFRATVFADIELEPFPVRWDVVNKLLKFTIPNTNDPTYYSPTSLDLVASLYMKGIFQYYPLLPTLL